MNNQDPELENKISELEQLILKQKEQLASLRKQRVPEKVQDYTFKDRDGQEVKLSKLFGNKNELLLIHNMGKSCPYCTLWADELNGVISHLASKVPVVVISPDTPEVTSRFAESRSWYFNILSSSENSFKKDMGFENKNGNPMPGVSVFIKDEKGNIFHKNKASFGPGDDFCSVWHYLALLPSDNSDWHPKYNYSNLTTRTS